MASASTPAAEAGLLQESDIYLRQAFFTEPRFERLYMKSLYKKPNFMSFLSQAGLMRRGSFDTGMSKITLEEDQRSSIVTLAAVAAPALGANVTVRITGPYNDQGFCVAQERYTVFLSNGLSGRVVSVTATANAYDVVLAPMTAPWPAIAAGTNMMFVAPSVGAASTALPYFFTKGLTAYEHRLQRLRWDTKVNDFAIQAEGQGRITVKLNSNMPTPWNGGVTKSWTSKNTQDWADQTELDINYGLLLADRDRLTVRAADGPSYLTGLYPSIRYGGGNNFITPATFSAAYFQNAAIAFLDSQTVGSASRTVLEGIDYTNKREDWVNTQTQQGNRSQALDEYVYGCSEIRNMAGMDWKFIPCTDFNDPRSLGAMGFRNKAIMLPTEMTREMSDGSMMPLFSVEYTPQPTGISGMPDGMLNYTYQPGPGFVPNGGVTSTANAEASLLLTCMAFLGTVIRGIEAYGLSE